jgi:acyl dehydratase
MNNSEGASMSNDYAKYIGLTSEPRISPPLELDMLRQFALAVMDTDPLYYDPMAGKSGPYGTVVAPPLFPIHMFRAQPGKADVLNPLQKNPDLDGTGSLDSILFGLPTIETGLVRLINGGNEIEFYRHLQLGETVRVTAKYADVTFKQSSKGPMLIAKIESTFEAGDGELLLISRTTSIHR